MVPTIEAAADAIAKGRLSPVELTQHVLDRIERLQPTLNAYIATDGDAALASARTAEDEIAKGLHRGPLHGIPIGIKDNVDAIGFPTTCAAAPALTTHPQRDADLVSRLRNAGAVVLGKLNMHEIAFGLYTSSAHFGRTANPWNPELSPGGSSGGSGAATAAGLCLGAIGTDTGGSVRIPSALCGVTGLRPSRGVVSRTGIVPMAPSLDTAGPLARTAVDAALLLDVVAGHDPQDDLSVPRPRWEQALPRAVEPSSLRVGVLVDDGWRGDAAISENLGKVVDVLAGAGAQVVDVVFDDLDGVVAAMRVNNHVEAAAQFREELEENPSMFGEDVQRLLRIGTAYSGIEYVLARRTAAALSSRMRQIFATVDVLLAPTVPHTAAGFVPGMRTGEGTVEQRNTSLLRYTSIASLAGLPALSIPSGLDADGLPTAAQVIGPALADDLVLGVGVAVQQRTAFHEAVPPLAA